MDFLNGITDFLLAINYKLIFQLTCLGLIVISGPVIIFLLSARGGDL
ncbi:MAG: photosystem II reaction center protein Ycf12/Psb30 [Pseudanabaenaceae cyanobacterium]